VATRVTLGTFSPSVLLRVARRAGLLDRFDLVVEESPVPSSPAQFRALIDGALDAVLTSPDNVIAYRYSSTNPLGETVDARIVCAVDRGLGLALYGRPGVRTLTEGGTFGVDVPTSGFAFALYAVAESLGLHRDSYQVSTLGSTPRRLEALLAGECDATMLNAGSELRAELAGCQLLARVRDVCHPYLGTVLAVVGPQRENHREDRLSAALRATAAAICAGELDEVTISEAAFALVLPPEQARRYLERLKDPDEGLIADGRVDPESMRTGVDLRRRYLPSVVDGVDLLASALAPGSGLLAVPEMAGRRRTRENGANDDPSDGPPEGGPED
jgi:hypothetical protein